MQLVLHNIGTVLTGKLDDPVLAADTIVVDDGRIVGFDDGLATTADTVIDCKGMTIAPGLVDTHVHPTAGDYAHKQQSVGYLERMTHGAVTRVMSAGEVHTPGRVNARSALAIAAGAYHSFRTFRPGGMKVHAGAMLLESDTDIGHIDEAHELGMRIIGEVGIGSLKDPVRSGELSRHARELGMTVHMHCGCTSDRGPGGDAHPHFTADDVFTIEPSIASHANTFASLSDEDIDRLCGADGPPHVEIVQAGGTRSMLRVVERLCETDSLDRLLIGTDTPTGYGVTSLGILKTIGDICSLADVAPETGWAIASGQGARAFGSDGNVIGVGREADLVVIDASLGSVEDSATEAIAAGEFPGVAATIIDGEVRVAGSLCTLRARRVVAISGA
ncbi:MAG: Enamidase [Acidimicrobiia bacterium]|nr:Enamidase [Acidimicrobiia bacterium]